MNKLLKKEAQIVAVTVLFVIFSVLSVWFLWQKVVLLTGVLFILAFFELAMVKSKKLVVVFFICCIGGGMVESAAIYFGNWQYANPTFFNIPLWLLPAWGNAGISIVAFHKWLGKIRFLEQEKIN